MSRRSVAIASLAGAVLVAGGVITSVVVRRSHHHKGPPAVALRPLAKAAPIGDKVTVRGGVYDQERGVPIGGVRVVMLPEGSSSSAELAAVTAADGSFTFTMPRGHYRVFVRDEQMMTVALQERMRLDNGPRAAIAGMLDPHLAPILDVEGDLDSIDVTVTKAAIVTGHVTDEDSHPVAGAVIRMRQPPTISSYLRPVLGTDIAITDDAGNYTLRLPAGEYQVDARHHDFASLSNISSQLSLSSGQHIKFDTTLTRGCFIRGKVVRTDGKTPSADGAIEADMSGGLTQFGPQSRVGVDGTFELALPAYGEVRVRAWPWKSAPSNAQTFTCDDGRRFEHITLKLQDFPAEIAGTLTDAHGNPVPFTYVDLKPLDPGLTGQQERTDAAGKFQIFDTFAGRYTLMATAEGRGIVETTITAPKTDIQLQLSGTGRISGTTTDLINGSLEISFLECDGSDPFELAPETQIVPVIGGHFTIERAPACSLHFFARWRNRSMQQSVVVDPNATAYVTLALGSPRDKAVRGIVRDSHGVPIAGARVTAVLDEREAATARTDKDGHYALTTKSGAQIIAGDHGRVGRGLVGRANVAAEEVDLLLDTVEDSP